MASLTNPIKAENIAARFADYVAATANSSIVWADNVNPTYTDPAPDKSTHVVVGDAAFGPSTAGIAPSVIGSSEGNLITAAGIVTFLVNETNRYRNIRQVQAKLSVTGSGGNKPAGPVSGASGLVYDETEVAYVVNTYRTDVIATTTSPNPATYGVAANQVISVTSLQSYMEALRTAYVAKSSVSVEIANTVCHASCHNSCHGSRSRR